MTLVTILSTCAMLLGLGGILPQLVRMVRSRSASGQAPLGWGLGCAAHASMAYVNFFGFGSLLLSASNVVARETRPRTCRSRPARRAPGRARTTHAAAQTTRA